MAAPLRRWLPSVAAAIAFALPAALSVRAAPVGKRPSEPPQRIVSAALAADEILLELAPPERIAGVTYLIDEPLASAAAGRAPKHATRIHGPVEPILALCPDSVVVAPWLPAETLTLLSASRASVIRLEAVGSFGDVIGNIRLLGRATKTEKRANALVAKLRARLEAVDALPRLTSAPRVLAWAHGYAFGAGTLVDDCIRRAGGSNAVTAHGELALGAEGALGLEPDVILVTTYAPSVQANARELLDETALSRGSGAVVHGIPAAWMGSMSHHAALALEAIARMLRAAS